MGILVVLVIVAASIGSLIFDRDFLESRQKLLQKRICSPELNMRLYDYYKSTGFSGKVLTDYQPFQYLPEIGHLYKGLQDFKKDIADPQVRYVLICSTMKSNFYSSIQQEIAQGRIALIFDEEGMLFAERDGGSK